MESPVDLPTQAEHLPDDVLLAELHACAVLARENDARMLVFLGEVEHRGIYLLRACSSMYDYCKRKLLMSDGQAYRRIAAARLVRRYPFLTALIARGVTHISTLAQIHTFVSDENVHALVADTAGKSRDEVDRVLGERFGLSRRPLSPKGVIVIDDELAGLIQRAFELECHAVPDGDRLKLAKRAFRALIAASEKRTRGKAARPRPARTEATSDISRESRRVMYETHGEQCSYVDETTGDRCGSRVFVQPDHIKMRVHGGSHAAVNLKPMCGPHNRLLAVLALGRERIQRAIRLRQRRSSDGEEPPASTGE